MLTAAAVLLAGPSAALVQQPVQRTTRLTAATPPAAAPTAPPARTGATPPVAATSPAAAPPEDIRDIRGPRALTPAWLWPAVIVGAILLLLAGYASWRRLRRAKPARPLLPFEVALARLEEIRALMQPQSVREFSSAVSDTVRGYIEQRFHVTAAQRTTEEFLHDLLSTTELGLARHRGLLADFLQQCDLAKFAEVSLSMQAMESLHRSARTFVLETAHPEPPAPDSAKARALS